MNPTTHRIATCDAGIQIQSQQDKNNVTTYTVNGKKMTDSDKYAGKCCTTTPCDTDISCDMHLFVNKDSNGDVKDYSTYIDDISQVPTAPKGLSFMTLDRSQLADVAKAEFAKMNIPFTNDALEKIQGRDTLSYFNEYADGQKMVDAIDANQMNCNEFNDNTFCDTQKALHTESYKMFTTNTGLLTQANNFRLKDPKVFYGIVAGAIVALALIIWLISKIISMLTAPQAPAPIYYGGKGRGFSGRVRKC